jgi:hypothetical protein
LEEKIIVLFNNFSPYFAHQQDFLRAKQTASFYIKFVEFDDRFDDDDDYDGDDDTLKRKIQAPLSLSNSQTGEKLVITKIEGEKYARGCNLTISRFPIGTNAEEWHSGMAQHSISNRRSWRHGGQYSKQEYRNIIIDI